MQRAGERSSTQVPLWELVRVGVHGCVCMCACVGVCVCETERERDLEESSAPILSIPKTEKSKTFVLREEKNLNVSKKFQIKSENNILKLFL